MGISQTRTREKLEADRRRQDEKKQNRVDPAKHSMRGLSSGNWQLPSHGNSTFNPDWKEERNFRFTYGARKDPHFQSISHRNLEAPGNRTSAKERLSFDKESALESQGQSLSRQKRSFSRNEWRPVHASSQAGTNSKTLPAQSSHTPSPRPQREGMSFHSPSSNQRTQVSSATSTERRSALARLSLPPERVPLLQDGVANVESGRLQEVDIHYLDENLNLHQSGGSNVPSSSRNPDKAPRTQYDPTQDRSPIRTLSEDRLHVSLRLGPLYVPEEPNESEDLDVPELSSKKRTRSVTSAAKLSSKVVRAPTPPPDGKEKALLK
ncbi:hypothetical protein Bca101_080536 [Brassica carinata]